MARKEQCKFEHCENPAHYPILGVCSTCYSGLRLWVGRSKAAKDKRMGQYERMQERMQYLLNGTGLMPGYTKKRKRKSGTPRNEKRS